MSFRKTFQCVASSLLGVTLLLAGCKPNIAPMTVQELKTVTELTKTMQTHCVGRFLIDLPASGSLGSSQAVGYRGDVKIETLGKMSEEAFQARMTQIENEYKTKKSRDEGISYLFSTSKPSSHTQIFERLEDDDTPQVARLIESYKWSAGAGFKLVVKASEISLEKPEAATRKLELGKDVAQRKKYMIELLERLRARETNEIPTEPGLCFDEGFLARKANSGQELKDDEEYKAGVSFKAHPDVSFVIRTDTDQPSNSTLLDNKDIPKMVAQKNARVLRQGSVKLQGIAQVEEILFEGETDDGNPVNGKLLRGNYFVLEANSKLSSLLTPTFRLTMRTGESIYVDHANTTTGPTLSDAQALALWDAVSKSIRVRPGAL